MTDATCSATAKPGSTLVRPVAAPLRRQHHPRRPAGIRVTHDAGGNLSALPGMTFTYNAKNELLRLETDGGLVADYGYDHLGMRVSKVVHQAAGTHVVRYLGDQAEIRDGVRSVIVTVAGLRLAVITQGEKRFVHDSPIGTTSFFTDESGEHVGSIDVHPFGGEASRNGDVDFACYSLHPIDPEHGSGDFDPGGIFPRQSSFVEHAALVEVESIDCSPVTPRGTQREVEFKRKDHATNCKETLSCISLGFVVLRCRFPRLCSGVCHVQDIGCLAVQPGDSSTQSRDLVIIGSSGDHYECDSRFCFPLSQLSPPVEICHDPSVNQSFAVDLQDICFSYPGIRAKPALSDISLTVSEGEIFGFLGPNGSGKTTLFRILATLLTPTSGKAQILGMDLATASHSVRGNIGVVFQKHSLDQKLTVSENLVCYGHLYGMRGLNLKKAGRSSTDSI